MIKAPKALRGVTLIEVLVVMAITAVLVSVLLPAVQLARESARCAQCKTNLKQIGLALQNYTETHGILPPGSINRGRYNQGGTVPNPYTKVLNHTGWLMLLPHLDQGSLYEQFDFNCATNAWLHTTEIPGGFVACGWGPGNPNFDKGLHSVKIKTLLCPSDDGFDRLANHTDNMHWVATNHAHTNYMFVGGSHFAGWDRPNLYSSYADSTGVVLMPSGLTPTVRARGSFGVNGAARFSDITDGLSNTLVIGESAIRNRTDSNARAGIWAADRHQGTWLMTHPSTDPNNVNNFRYHINGGVEYKGKTNSNPYDDPRHHECVMSSVHKNGAHALKGDGTVVFLNESMNHTIFALLGRIADGESAAIDD